MPRVISVIESEVLRGKGTDDDPCRRVVQYHTFDGEFLAERDDWAYHTAEQEQGVKEE